MIHRRPAIWITVITLITMTFDWAANPVLGAESKTWGLIVAVESYTDSRIPVAPHAAKHARGLAKLFEDSSLFPAIGPRLKVLAGGSNSASAKSPTAAHIRSAFAEIARQAEAGDRLLLVLIASTTPAGDEVRWLAADANENDLAATTLLSSEIGELIASTGCELTFSIVDASSTLTSWKLSNTEVTQWRSDILFRELNGTDRAYLASSNGKLKDMMEWETVSTTFFQAVTSGIKGAADNDGGEPDGWITEKELVAYVTTQAPQSVSDGTEFSFWLSQNPEGRKEFESRKSALTKRHQSNELDDREFEHGLRVLERMPSFDDDRKLRSAYISFLNGKTTEDDLATLRRQTITKRNLPEDQGVAFGRRVAEVIELIRSRHIHPEKANQALAIGLRELADQYGDSNEPWVDEAINSIDKLDSTQLENALIRFRLRLGYRPEVKESAVDICLKGVLGFLDPYSVYLSPEVYRDMKEQVAGKFTGIGVILQENPSSESLPILLVIPGGPADKAGLHIGDRIIALDGKSVSDVGVEQASRYLLGPEGSLVKITVERKNSDPLEFTIARGEVELESVVGYDRKEDGSWNYWVDREHGIGYVRIATFAVDTADRLRKTIAELGKDGLKDLILDLRFNPGGLLTSAINVADVFVDDGSIVRIQDRRGQEREVKAHRFGTIEGINLVVMVNEGSASGSEIVAAAIQDSGRGKIAGSRTFGKGSAQDIVPLKDNESAVKLTSEAFFRPSGKNLERFRGGRRSADDTWGVSPSPDLDLPLYREESSRLRADMFRRLFIGRSSDEKRPPDRQLEKLLQVLRSQSPTIPPK
ncbi:S41 family peptidase [bacterium]|nr:S41 family peptidase [bacterium]